MATKLIFGALAAMSGTLALSSSLTFVSAPASAFEVERGSHGASRIVSKKQTKISTPQLNSAPHKQTTTLTTAPRRFRVVRGPHGVQRIISQ